MLLLTIFTAIVQQQYDPIAFLEQQRRSGRGLWRSAWLLRGAMLLAMPLILGIVAGLSGHSWGVMFACAVFVLMILQMAVSLPIILTQPPQFWLAYAYSPPAIIVTLFCGLGIFFPVWTILGYGLGLPFLFGILISDACTMWVYKQLKDIENDRRRMRRGGPVPDLPALALYRQARLARLMISMVAVPIVGWLFIDTDLALIGCLAVLAILFGCLHLEATLLSSILKLPLAQFDPQQEEWRASYIGRSALFILPKRIRQAIVSASCPAEGGAILLALLREGYLGAIIHRAINKMPPDQLQPILLHLSLQEGGAEAIRYIQPALPPSLDPIASCYAALATEAAKPLDLQRWLTVLVDQLPPEAETLRTEPGPTLAGVREALLTHTHSPQAMAHLYSFVASLYNLPPSDIQSMVQLKTVPLTWPLALLFHLDRHHRRLLSS